MRLFFLVFCSIVLLARCQQQAPNTAQDLQKLKQDLEAKKRELADKQEIAEVEKELEAVEKQIQSIEKSPQAPQEVAENKPADPPSSPENAQETNQSTITGSNVTMRKDASIQSDKIGSFSAGEKVTVLESKNVNNDQEAILTKPVTLKGDGGAVTLTKGKAVIIEEYQSERNYYAVRYEDPQKGKLTADIPADAIETISYATWYRVRKSNGETGWVLGKFLKN